MKVIVNDQPVVVTPPKTYDLIGLTYEEMFLFRGALLNYTGGQGPDYDSNAAVTMHDRIAKGMR